MNETVKEVSILSIDAWRDIDGGWFWNAWYKVGTIERSLCDLPPRKLLRYLRERGILTPGSAGKVAIEDDQYNVVIVAKGTREPLIALAYGEVVD